MSKLEASIGELYGQNFKYLTDGKLFGVEVEVESVSELPPYPGKVWETKHDGSLRGFSREYVFSGPISLSAAEAAIENLYRLFADRGVPVTNSMRAGVHIHINQQHRTVKQVMTFLSAYWLVEDYLVDKYCGAERAGNLFCLRLKDADFPLSYVVRRLSSGGTPISTSSVDNDYIRYAAANLSSLASFGTIEFRALRTPTTPQPIIDWIRVLNHIEEASLAFSSPRDLLESCSGEGVVQIASRLLGERLDEEQHARPLQEALWRVQPLAYNVNWS